MIHIEPKPEPAVFDKRVRKPGSKFLERYETETKKPEFPDYWTRILALLHDQYGGICAYSCHWMPYDTGADTVEHFLPKSLYPCKAHEWTNYRLVCATLNGRKGDHMDTLDPFEIENGWFVLRFPSLQVFPSDGLKPELAAKVQATIDRLRLNDYATCLRSRLRYVDCYCRRSFTFEHLQEEAPFIAMELQRQGLTQTDTLCAMMSATPSE